MLTRVPPGRTPYGDRLTVELATVPERDRRVFRGLPATSVRRTVADCLCHLPPADGLAVADAAVRLSPGPPGLNPGHTPAPGQQRGS